MKGKILWYSDRDKNGIIKREDGFEFYFDISVWKTQVVEPKSGYLVVFEHNETIKDCRCAKNVKAELLA